MEVVNSGVLRGVIKGILQTLKEVEGNEGWEEDEERKDCEEIVEEENKEPVEKRLLAVDFDCKAWKEISTGEKTGYDFTQCTCVSCELVRSEFRSTVAPDIIIDNLLFKIANLYIETKRGVAITFDGYWDERMKFEYKPYDASDNNLPFFYGTDDIAFVVGFRNVQDRSISGIGRDVRKNCKKHLTPYPLAKTGPLSQKILAGADVWKDKTFDSEYTFNKVIYCCNNTKTVFSNLANGSIGVNYKECENNPVEYVKTRLSNLTNVGLDLLLDSCSYTPTNGTISACVNRLVCGMINSISSAAKRGDKNYHLPYIADLTLHVVRPLLWSLNKSLIELDDDKNPTIVACVDRNLVVRNSNVLGEFHLGGFDMTSEYGKLQLDVSNEMASGRGVKVKCTTPEGIVQQDFDVTKLDKKDPTGCFVDLLGMSLKPVQMEVDYYQSDMLKNGSMMKRCNTFYLKSRNYAKKLINKILTTSDSDVAKFSHFAEEIEVELEDEKKAEYYIDRVVKRLISHCESFSYNPCPGCAPDYGDQSELYLWLAEHTYTTSFWKIYFIFKLYDTIVEHTFCHPQCQENVGHYAETIQSICDELGNCFTGLNEPWLAGFIDKIVKGFFFSTGLDERYYDPLVFSAMGTGTKGKGDAEKVETMKEESTEKKAKRKKVKKGKKNNARKK